LLTVEQSINTNFELSGWKDMANVNKTRSHYLLTGLLLITMAGAVEARPGHQSNNRHHYDRGHHSSYHPVGHRVSLLPLGYLALTFAGLHYYYNSGTYYQRVGHEYAVVRPAVGLGISILPAGYRTVYYGRNRYYSANGIFYRWNDNRRNYIVVDEPDPNVISVSTAAHIPEQYVYPKQGQNDTQTSRDRYECYLWAVDQTGVEPAQLSNSNNFNNAENYQRANGACLEARGYSVR
jgi:hypothetical protein